MSSQNTLTTGEVAEICNVSQRTVIRWIDSGRLKGHRFPGAGAHRRIFLTDLRAFLNDNELPVPGDLLEQRNRVLIVEDEAIVALLIEEVLEGAGYETRIATNGFSAGQLLESFNPHVMTLDLNMPGIPGIEVLSALLKSGKNKDLGILVVSGMPKNQLDEVLDKGAHEVLPKPFLNKVLLECVGRLIHLSSTEDISLEGG